MTAARPDIALLINSLRGGGAEKVMVVLANGFAERGLHVHLVTGRAQGPYAADVVPAVKRIDFGTNRAWHAFVALARYVRRVRPRVLMSASAMCNVAAVLATRLMPGRPRVVLREDAAPSLESPYRNKAASDLHGVSRLVHRAVPWIYPAGDLVISPSKGTAQDLTENFRVPVQRSRTIANPVLPPDLEKRKGEPADHPWMDEDIPVMLAVGRLCHAKDYPTLLHAFARVRAARASRLLILGEGPQRAALEALVAELGLQRDVALPGFRSNPFAFMARAAVYVLSSVREGLSNTLVEALACGCPVVSTDCPYGPSEILDNGTHGILVPPGDAEALAAALQRAMDEERPPTDPDWLRQFSRNTVVDRYLQEIFPERELHQ